MSAEPAILPILLPQDPGPAPEPPATGPVPPSRWRALWVRLVGVLRPGWRDRTPLEVQLTHEVARLRYRLWEVENQVFGLKHALSVKDSELRIQAREIAL